MVIGTAQMSLGGIGAMPSELRARRADGLYSLHAYHTKVPPSAIEACIEAHTRPGDVVLDPFCGSGMTGVAAARTGRRAFLNDLSPAAIHIARNYTTPCDPDAFEGGVARVLAAVGERIAALYATTHHGRRATIEHLVWSDVRACPSCAAKIVLWTLRDAGLRRITCPSCNEEHPKASMPFVDETPVEANLSGLGPRRVIRPAEPSDAGNLGATERIPWHPRTPFGPSRPMWRRGHADLGIATVADFYSRRNLIALALLWEAASAETDGRVRDALRFSLTAIANRASRRYQWNAKRPTNVLGGTLYISSLRYEWNVLSLWRRKVAAVARFFAANAVPADSVHVMQGSATRLPLPDESVDYCFTDPPFGAHIVYSDASLLWEAWLDDFTDREEEAIVVRGGDVPKQVGDYGELLAAAFGEVRRVLKADGEATVVFQATDPTVWAVVQAAASQAGLSVVDTGTLDKGQPSFKQIKGRTAGERVAATDVMLHFAKRASEARPRATTVEEAVAAACRDARERGKPFMVDQLYAGVVAHLVRGELPVLGFAEIASLIDEHSEADLPRAA